MSKKIVLIPLFIILLMQILPAFKATGASTILGVNPPTTYVTVNKTLNVDVNVTDVTNLTSWQLTLYFLNSVLNCTDVVEGPFLKTGGGTFFGKTINNNYNSTHGSVQAYSTLLGATHVDGSGALVTMTFKALIVGDSTLHLADTKLGDEKIPPQPIAHTVNDGTAHVQAFTLTVSTTGSGLVTLNETGPYHYGEVVQLTGTAGVGWTFDHWSGDLAGSTNPAALTITGNMSVTAVFTQDEYTLTITISGGGNVTKNPDQATYTYGTNVTLTANANVGWTFASWSGDASGTSNPTTVNITGNKAVTATFSQNTYTLTVNTVGQGSVSRNNTGPYHYGDVVQLTAVPTIGWSFGSWSGDLGGSLNPTTILINGNKDVTATFTQNTYTLTVSIDPLGKGSVILNNSGPYHYGDTVELTANPVIGWSFDHWGGDLSGSTNPTTILINGNKAVTATFTQNVYTLTVNIVGSGSVNRNNSGPYHYGDTVQLTAVPAVGWTFNQWSQDLTGSSNPANLLINGNKVVNATFTQDQYTLTITTSGSGSVTKDPNQATYTYGTNVTLTANPSPGWSFASWSGDASGTSNPTTINMTGNKAVTATFTQNSYTLTVTTVGSGSVTLNVSGPYLYGDAVLLNASANTGWIFHYWSGSLTGSTNPATLIMTGNFSVTAYFTQKPALLMSPSSRTCRVFSENFSIAISVSNALEVRDFAFEIRYNTTLLDYVSITWNAWGSGTINVNEATGTITGYTTGTAFNGTQTLITVRFTATFAHVWKSAVGWVNDLVDTIVIQKANMSYVAGPDLRYEKGSLNQIDVGPDFAYTFSPIMGDVTIDGKVDLIDLRLVAAFFGVKQGDGSWSTASTYDLDGNLIIDVFDLRIIAANYLYEYIPPP